MSRIAIVGAGPAGISASLEARKLFPDAEITIYESGPNMATRMANVSKFMINGQFGAGMFSDRKFSVFPAGSGLLAQNPHMVLDLCIRHLNYMNSALGNDLMNPLIDATNEFYKGQSFENLERIRKDLAQLEYKPYPCVTLPNVDDSMKIVKFYDNLLKEAKIQILYNTFITNMTNRDNVYKLSVANQNAHSADQVIIATGRFTAWQNLVTEVQPKGYKRMELGVRLMMFPQLENAVRKLSVKDPKFKVRRNYIICGKSIPVEFRTFCVCLDGYIAETYDRNTQTRSVSGSSSINEFELRSDMDKVYKGSNMGITMIIRDAEVIHNLEDSMHRCECSCVDYDREKNDAGTLTFIMETLRPIMIQGVEEILHLILGGEIDTNVIRMYGPCVEGTGKYYNTEASMKIQKNMVIAGDACGTSRGLVQAFITGGLSAWALYLESLTNKLNLSNTQDLIPVALEYNKIRLSPASYPNLTLPENMVLDTVKYEESMFPVHFVGNNNMGVTYELHHFFLDTNTQAQGILEQISLQGLLDYLALCDVVDRNRETIVNNIISTMNFTISENVRNQLYKTFMGHEIKACVLALRVRESIEKRLDYMDLPILQSAFKFTPVLKDMTDMTTAYLIVSHVANYMTSLFTTLVSQNSLALALKRVKIETQEVCVLPRPEALTDVNRAMYLECHVKINIKYLDDRIASYEHRRRVIQHLADLLEGNKSVIQRVFKTIGVSINLLKHPSGEQQFFLTYRDVDPKNMQFLRSIFNKFIQKLTRLDPSGFLRNYQLVAIPDSEYVIYDNWGEMDRLSGASWFPMPTGYTPYKFGIDNTDAFLFDGFNNYLTSLLNAKQQITLVTKNPDKVREIRNMAPEGFCVHSYDAQLDDPHIISIRDSAVDKVYKAYTMLKRPVVVECTGLEILGEYPGAFTSLTYEHMGDDFNHKFNGNSTVARTVVAYHNGTHVSVYEGIIHGKISSQKMGSNGFGWDPSFIIDGSTTTMAQLSDIEKQKISMRTMAFMQLFQELAQ